MNENDRSLAIAGCCVALGSLIPVALYQSGIIKRLPDPPGKLFHSEEITASALAHPFGVPDSYLGLASYGATLALLLLAKRSSPARTLLGAKLAADAGAAGFNVARQIVVFGKLCGWCTATALATAVMAYAGRATIVETAQMARRAL